MTLTQRKNMHVRLQGGALYGYEIMDDGAVIGSKTATIDKRTRPWTETVAYFLGDREFATAAEFQKTYEAEKRGESGCPNTSLTSP